MATVTRQGNHIAAEVRAVLILFYGVRGQWVTVADLMHTVPTKDRMGLVTMHGEDYTFAYIGTRMLQPREFYRVQRIDPVGKGKPLQNAAQVCMCGNSVCRPIMQALAAANRGQEYVVDNWHDVPACALGQHGSLAL